MSRVVLWLQQHEYRMFRLVNGRMRHGLLDALLNRITHLGGASFTIAATVIAFLAAPRPWSLVALQSMLALALSHLPVAVMKRKYPRLRPYLVLPQTNTCKKPLTDHSFPSGHTTAIFSVVVPFVAAAPALGFALLPLAFTVALSRIYLGLHYPSDCAVGALVGASSALVVVGVI